MSISNNVAYCVGCRSQKKKSISCKLPKGARRDPQFLNFRAMKLCFYISSASKLETWMAKDDATGCPDKFGTGDFKHYSNNAKKA